MGKIGKPQKSKKHKKLKKTIDTDNDNDFYVDRKGKLSNLPVQDADLDRQDIPRKAKEILQSKQNMSKQKIKGKVNKKRKMKKAAELYASLPGMTKPLKPVPQFVQGKRETDKDFMRRVEVETHRVVMTAKMEDKYKIDLTKTKLNKNSVVKKGPSERKKEKDKDRKRKKVLAHQQKRLEKEMDFSALKDKVEFGEVVMAPPTFTAKPRKAAGDDSKPRPGQRSLLLKSMFETAATDASKQIAAAKSVAQRQIGQSVKRKNLSPAQRQISDFQRQKAVDLYRQMRNTKYEMNNLKT